MALRSSHFSFHYFVPFSPAIRGNLEPAKDFETRLYLQTQTTKDVNEV